MGAVNNTDQGRKPEWFYKKSFLIIGFLIFGPLILPFIWFNPQFNRFQKILLSAAVILITAALIAWSYKIMQPIYQYYKDIFKTLKLS